MRIIRESRSAFATECQFNELHFELFHGIFNKKNSQMEKKQTFQKLKTKVLLDLKKYIYIYIYIRKNNGLVILQ